jgi:hypothetical protein
MTAIALVTDQKHTNLTSDDRLLVKPLLARGIEVAALPWDAPHTDWTWFDAVVVRSTWDYHRRPAEFAAWLAHLKAANVNLWNPPDVLLWNMDKRYLLDLAAEGVPIVPTVLLPEGRPADLPALLVSRGWSQAVIKPAISASAYSTWPVSLEEASTYQAALDALLASTSALVQPLMPEIYAGEWSVIFLGGTYSHTVLKRPGKNTIFVQDELGGTSTVCDPPAGLIGQAAAALHAAETITGCETPLLYVRVDGLLVDGRLTLMELEAIEPLLFLDSSPDAAERFVEALVNALAYPLF